MLAILVLAGTLIFASAAFGLVARGSINISSVAFNHLALGVGLGLMALIIATNIDYRSWRQFAPYIYVFTLIMTALVFVPQLGMEHGGGRRWLDIFGFSLQPSEFLKIGAIIMAAAYFSSIRPLVGSWIYGLGGYLVVLAGPALILVLQPDLGTLGVIAFSISAIYFASGARLRHVVVILCVGIIALSLLSIARPYVRDRVMTFFDPSQGQQAEGYQIRQSLIAIGSGGLMGRGFGQGVQKFTYLPEPMGDSIFAVVGEELGFIGSVLLILLFLAFALRGYRVATHSSDPFGALLAVGIATYLASEAFINIAAMLGVAPLTGIPLTFISQGGSAMLASLAAAGILLSVSRYHQAKH
ncbi:MAG: putative peptidoglycan glycosyltransferase FtsW [bacterium]|nr:putative peptidoglycan glycosyltransferase FtsW [bacterium]